jgi:hypothetical protein
LLYTLPIVVALFAQSAAGAPAPGAASASGAAAVASPKERAQALLKEGSALYKRSDFAGALKKFEAAYALYPSPKLQFNIGQADRELGRIVEAVEAFETFLMQAPDAAPAIVGEARKSLAELKPKLAQLKIDAVAGAQVTVDGRSFGFTPLARIVWVAAGDHHVEIKHPSYLPASLAVTVAAGEIRTVAPSLRAAGEPAAATVTTPPVPGLARRATPPPDGVAIVSVPAPAPASSSSSSSSSAPALAQTVASKDGAFARKPWYFWTAAAATVLFTGGAVAAGLSANQKYRDLETGCGVSATGCSEGEIDGVQSRATLANVLWVLAGASAVATGVTFYMDGHEAGAAVALKF